MGFDPRDTHPFALVQDTSFGERDCWQVHGVYRTREDAERAGDEIFREGERAGRGKWWYGPRHSFEVWERNVQMDEDLGLGPDEAAEEEA